MRSRINAIIGTVEKHPVRALCLLAALVLPFSLLVSHYYAASWVQGRTLQTLSKTDASVRQDAGKIASNVEIELGKVKKQAWLLSTDQRIGSLLRHPDAALLHEVNVYLRDFAATMGLHRAYLLDAQGLCIAASNFEDTKPLIGTDFKDRRYFISALRSGTGMQFVVGRVSSVPGFHFAHTVRRENSILGVAVIKIDPQTLMDRIHFTNGFVTDDQGVVVLAAEPEHLLRVLPGAPATQVPQETLQRRYQRSSLQQLVMSSSLLEGVEIHTYGRNIAPSLQCMVELPGQDLSVNVFQNVSGIDALNEQYWTRFLFATLGIFFSLMLFLSFGIHIARDTSQRRQLIALNQELKKQAQLDPLTGYYNQRRFDEILQGELKRSARSNKPLSLALLEVDNFKSLKDTFGHVLGDKVLLHAAEIFRQHLRDTDFIARIGEAEFALLLPESTEDQAVDTIKRLLARIEASTLQLESASITPTLSAGIAQTSPYHIPQELLPLAHMALSAAKTRGCGHMMRASSLPSVHSPESGGIPSAPPGLES